MHNVHKILVPYDFDEMSPRALDHAIELAANLGASITLVHVAEGHVHRPDSASPSPPHAIRQVEFDALAGLRRIVEAHHARGLTIELVVRVGVPWEQIVQEAAARKADLVVMASHHHRGVARKLLGDVTQMVFRSAPCPVVVVNAADTAVEHAPRAEDC